MVFNFVTLALIVGLIWLSILTYLLWKYIQHYNNLTQGASDKPLSALLESLLKDIHALQKRTEELNIKCDTIEKEGVLHVQKIGLLRFNPFKDTGGDQSFILSLIDGNNSGVVISSLYSRAGTRWYAKKISMGKAAEHELSDEEKKALKDAVK